MKFIITLVAVLMLSVGAAGQDSGGSVIQISGGKYDRGAVEIEQSAPVSQTPQEGRYRELEIEVFTKEFKERSREKEFKDYADIEIFFDGVGYKMTLDEFKRRITGLVMTPGMLSQDLPTLDSLRSCLPIGTLTLTPTPGILANPYGQTPFLSLRSTQAVWDGCIQTDEDKALGRVVRRNWHGIDCPPVPDTRRVVNRAEFDRINTEIVLRNALPSDYNVVLETETARAVTADLPRKPSRQRKYAHAQQKPGAAISKPISDTSKPPAPIPVPELEAAKIQALRKEAADAEATYMEKVKEPLAAFKKEMELITAKYDLLIVQAGAKSNLSFSQMQTLVPLPDETGKLVWKPKPEAPKEK